MICLSLMSRHYGPDDPRYYLMQSRQDRGLSDDTILTLSTRFHNPFSLSHTLPGIYEVIYGLLQGLTSTHRLRQEVSIDNDGKYTKKEP